MMRLRARSFVIFAAAVFAMAAVAVYIVLDPVGTESGIYFPKCLFHLLTGLECPGCGSQRALHSLLNGHIAAAFPYNALLVILLPYGVLWAVLSSVKRFAAGRPAEFAGRAYSFLYRGKAVWAMLAVVLIFWLFRNFSAAF